MLMPLNIKKSQEYKKKRKKEMTKTTNKLNDQK